MSMADPLISDEHLAGIRISYRRNDEITLLLRELERVKAHNAYLTQMFYGVASLKVCERHNAVPVTDAVRYERVITSWCQDCKAEDLIAMVEGHPEATTMARRLEAAEGRCLNYVLENLYLRERLGIPAKEPVWPNAPKAPAARVPAP